MPHQNPHAPNATAQNAATEPQAPNEKGRGQGRRPEPRSYAAPDVEDSTLAAPAAGETAEYADEGEPSGGMQQGQTRTRLAEKDVGSAQGAKTQAANRRMFNAGSPGQGSR